MTAPTYITVNTWPCKINAASTDMLATTSTTVYDATDAAATNTTPVDCAKVTATGGAGNKLKEAITAGGACCADFVISTTDTTAVASATGSLALTVDSVSNFCIKAPADVTASATAAAEGLVKDLIGKSAATTLGAQYTGTLLKAKYRCAWNMKTLKCEKGKAGDTKCQDTKESYGTDSCCWYWKMGSTDVPATTKTSLALASSDYPTTKDSEAYVCIKKADSLGNGYWGYTTLTSKQSNAKENKFDMKVPMGINDISFAAGYCAGSLALQVSAAVAVVATLASF